METTTLYAMSKTEYSMLKASNPTRRLRSKLENQKSKSQKLKSSQQKQQSPKRSRKQSQSPRRARRREFSNTRLGWLIMMESPVLYEAITSVNRSPSKDFLRSLAISSEDPFLKSEEFWKELVDYSPYKFWEPTAEEELERIRKSNFIIIRRFLSV